MVNKSFVARCRYGDVTVGVVVDENSPFDSLCKIICSRFVGLTYGSFSFTYNIGDEVELVLSCDDGFSCMMQSLEYVDSKFVYIYVKKSVDRNIVCCSKENAVVSSKSCLVSGEVDDEVAYDIYQKNRKHFICWWENTTF